MKLVDSHLHFDVFDAAGEVDAIINRARTAGVDWLVAIGGRAEANRLVHRLVESYPKRIYGAVGYDRDAAGQDLPLSDVKSAAEGAGIVAVGETGLDYHYDADSAAAQRALFGQMMEIAAGMGLPLVIHSRDADDDTVAMLKEFADMHPADAGPVGVLHCFTGSAAFAERLLELGLYISFSGIITFKNAQALREVAAQVPEDRLLIETDAPYLAPVPYRGKQNEPAYVVHVAEALAKIRNDSVAHIADITTQNARALFGLPGTEADCKE